MCDGVYAGACTDAVSLWRWSMNDDDWLVKERYLLRYDLSRTLSKGVVGEVFNIYNHARVCVNWTRTVSVISTLFSLLVKPMKTITRSTTFAWKLLRLWVPWSGSRVGRLDKSSRLLMGTKQKQNTKPWHDWHELFAYNSRKFVNANRSHLSKHGLF